MRLHPFVTASFLLFPIAWANADGLPAVSAPPAPITLVAGEPNDGLDLADVFHVPGVEGPFARFSTVLGDFDIELLPDAAPNHVANFFAYASAQAYDNTIFHRVLSFGPAPSILQGGAFQSVFNLAPVPNFAPVALEYALPNTRGTLAAMRTGGADSATSQWFFNTTDNTTELGPLGDGFGYTVFARVLGTGMTVVDQITGLPSTHLNTGVLADMPLRDVDPAQENLFIDNLVTIHTVREIPVYPPSNYGEGLLRFTATSDDNSVVAVGIQGASLSLTPGAAGYATITLTALDVRGNAATTELAVTVVSADPLVAWRQANFATTESSGSAADSADPDGDGLPNLLEYAVGASPTEAGPSPVVPGRVAAFLTLTYPRIADPALLYSVEVADALSGPWTTLAAPGNPSFGAANVAGLVTIVDPASLADHPRRFLRLRVSR